MHSGTRARDMPPARETEPQQTRRQYRRRRRFRHQGRVADSGEARIGELEHRSAARPAAPRGRAEQIAARIGNEPAKGISACRAAGEVRQ